MASVVAACSGDDDDDTSELDPAAFEHRGGAGADRGRLLDGAAATDTTPPATPPGLVLGYLRPAAGLLLDLSGAQQAALQLAAEDIAAAVLGGSLEVLTVDEPPDGDVAASVNDVLDQGANGILGPVGSTSARAACQRSPSEGASLLGVGDSADLTADEHGSVRPYRDLRLGHGPVRGGTADCSA